MMSNWTDRLYDWVVELIDALFGVAVFSIHTVRTFWTWHLRGFFPTTHNNLTVSLQVGSPLIAGKQVQVHMFVAQGMADHTIYLMSEAFLTPSFRQWLKESGAYKISAFEPFKTSAHSRYVVIYFSSEAQAALFKLTWGSDA